MASGHVSQTCDLSPVSTKLRSVQPYYQTTSVQHVNPRASHSSHPPLWAPKLFLMMIIPGCASATLQRGDALLVPCCSFVGAADHCSCCHVRTAPAISGNRYTRGLQDAPLRPVKLHAGSRTETISPVVFATQQHILLEAPGQSRL
jgi:hypothetical protein